MWVDWERMHTAGEQQLAVSMSNYWSNFAATADPNIPNPSGGGPLPANTTLVRWRNYSFSGGADAALLLETPPRVRMAGYIDEMARCEFWDLFTCKLPECGASSYPVNSSKLPPPGWPERRAVPGWGQLGGGTGGCSAESESGSTIHDDGIF